MLPLHPIATAIQADREREIRERSPRVAGLPSGRRHPEVPETSEVEDARARAREARLRAPRTRVALGSEA